MSPAQDVVLSPSTLKRIRALSRPITILVSVALGLLVAVQTAEIAAVLLAFHKGDAWQGQASFTADGFGLSVFDAAHPIPPSFGVMVDKLGAGERLEIAALAAGCAGCAAMALFNLRQLFALYSRGAVFSASNVARMKAFALWLVLAVIAVNVCGRIFLATIGGLVAYPPGNVVLTLVYGAMIYVMARVMELACEADQERREFV
jgi:hypothetical protein